MTATDNLYILDDGNDNKKSIDILEYINNRIQYINDITKRHIRPYILTPKMLGNEKISEKLKERKVDRLPALVVFDPRHEVFVGVDEIRFFYETLMDSIKTQYQKKETESKKESDPYGSEVPLLDDTNALMHQFYSGEVTGKEQERSQGADLGTSMSDRYKKSIMTRSKGPTQPGRNPGGGELGEEDGFDFSRSMNDRRRGKSSTSVEESLSPPSESGGGGDNGGKVKDNVMDSVRKACKDGGDDIELQFYANMLESSDNL